MSLLFAIEDISSWMIDGGKGVVFIAAVLTAIAVLAKTPYIKRPILWLFRNLISTPMAGWGKRVVTDVVSPRLESQDDQLSELMGFVGAAEANQKDIKAALKNLHECLDRRSTENNEAIAKLTAYAEEVLAEAVGAKERIRQLYKALDIPVFESDAHGHFTYVNPAFSKLTGLIGDESLGEGWVEALMPGDRARVFKAWASATDSHIDFNSVFRYKNMISGHETKVRGSAKPIHDGRGEVVGWVGTLDLIDME